MPWDEDHSGPGDDANEAHDPRAEDVPRTDVDASDVGFAAGLTDNPETNAHRVSRNEDHTFIDDPTSGTENGSHDGLPDANSAGADSTLSPFSDSELVPTAAADDVDADDDAALILPTAPGAAAPLHVSLRWDPVASALHIAAELNHIEEEIRGLLEPLDPRHKRKFSGTRRWHELEDDLRAVRFLGRIPEPTIARILQLVARRHSHFRRLEFLSGTRPTWNS